MDNENIHALFWTIQFHQNILNHFSTYTNLSSAIYHTQFHYKLGFKCLYLDKVYIREYIVTL